MAVCLWIIFDSVCNSVFKSQVLNVAKNFVNHQKYEKVVIASFEKNVKDSSVWLENLEPVPGVVFEIIPRKWVLTAWIMQSSYKEAILDLVYKHKPESIITRGAIATVLTKQAISLLNEPVLLNQKSSGITLSPAKVIGKKYTLSSPGAGLKPKLLVQARGLLEKEFLYIAQESYLYYFNFIFYKFMAWQYRQIEKKAYDKNELKDLDYSIEVVSNELGEYLVKNFGADEGKIYLSTLDNQKAVTKDKQKKNSEEIRAKLGFGEKTVYAFSGSYKPWQCPAKTIKMYLDASKDVSNRYLLILTHDVAQYETLARSLCKRDFLVLKIEDQEEYMKVLSACNYGLIYRDNNIVNSVSRPVKAMDYFAAGLEVIHNGTVPWIIQKIEIRERMKKTLGKKSEEFHQTQL